jgi:hypothetical protein
LCFAFCPLPAGAAIESFPPTSPWLQWTRSIEALSCPDATAFTANVEERLGTAPVVAAGRIRARVSIKIDRFAVPAGSTPLWRGIMELHDPEDQRLGRRELEQRADSCGPLADTLAFMTALALSVPSEQSTVGGDQPEPLRAPAAESARIDDLNLVRTLAQTSPTLTATPPLEATPPLTATPTLTPNLTPTTVATGRAPSISPSGRTEFHLAAGGAAILGMLPKAAFGPVLSLYAVEPQSRTGFLIWSGFWPRQSTWVDGVGGFTAELILAGAGVCPFQVRRPSRSGSLCATLDAGRMQTSGVAVQDAVTQARWVADAGAGAEFQQTITGGWFAGLAARAMVPLVRPRVGYLRDNGEAQSLFRASPLAALVEFRIGYALK